MRISKAFIVSGFRYFGDVNGAFEFFVCLWFLFEKTSRERESKQWRRRIFKCLFSFKKLLQNDEEKAKERKTLKLNIPFRKLIDKDWVLMINRVGKMKASQRGMSWTTASISSFVHHHYTDLYYNILHWNLLHQNNVLLACRLLYKLCRYTCLSLEYTMWFSRRKSMNENVWMMKDILPCKARDMNYW